MRISQSNPELAYASWSTGSHSERTAACGRDASFVCPELGVYELGTSGGSAVSLGKLDGADPDRSKRARDRVRIVAAASEGGVGLLHL